MDVFWLRVNSISELLDVRQAIAEKTKNSAALIGEVESWLQGSYCSICEAQGKAWQNLQDVPT